MRVSAGWRLGGARACLSGALVAGLCCAAGIFAASAGAVVASPGFTISVVSGPTIFSVEHDGLSEGNPPDDYTVRVMNSGNEPTNGEPITIADTLPAGVTLRSISGGIRIPSCDEVAVTCTYNGVLKPGELLYIVVRVSVTPGTVGPVTDSATVSGGGVASVVTNVTTALGSAASSLAEPFGLAYLSQQVTGLNGLTDNQAGDHPLAQTLSFSLNTIDRRATGNYAAAGGIDGSPAKLKDVVADLPPGFLGDPDAVERCPQYDISVEACPPSTQIGVARIVIFGRSTTEEGGTLVPIYNVVPDKGYAAEFVISVLGNIPAPLYVKFGPETNYAVQVISEGIPGVAEPIDVIVTFFGTPVTNLDMFNKLPTSDSGAAPVAFLDNPTRCGSEPSETTISADSWENPGRWLPNGSPDLSDPAWMKYQTTMFPSLVGCESLQFDPAVSVAPETTQADEPAGVSVDLKVPQAPQQAPALTTPDLKDTTVTLPEGMSLSPSAGDGLEGCSEAQFAAGSSEAASCPNGSQIGSASATTALLNEPLEGQIYLGDPACDPCTNADASDGNMFRLLLQLRGQGVTIKTEGRIYANTTTGQLTTKFTNLPQAPIDEVQLHFNSGLRAGLATPQTCGTATTTTDFTPWSTPVTPDATPSSSFQVDWDGHGGACPAVMPFAPSFSAGTSNPNAGQFSPLTLTFSRGDREQDLSGIQVHTPPGLLGMLSSVPLCGQPQASLGTCPASSQIGKMTVAAGPGSHPFYQQGQIYLTGPYDGAPFGLSIVVPTVAGPFNLGNVVVRAQIEVNPETTALTVTSEPLPRILDGIPLRLRTANVTIDRPGFIFNPTNCAQQSISATISAAQGAQTQVSTPFAVSGCAGLSFHPTFDVSTSGRTSRQNGASLDAKLLYPTGAQSAIAKVKVELPKQLPSRLTTLQKACPEAVFVANPASCPTAAIVGIAKAVTPVMPVPLSGPAYFVSHGGEAFPNLVVVLQGYGVRINLLGDTFINKQGITSSTFTNVPDVPVTSFELILPEGAHSALAANGDLCKEKLQMPVTFTAQDGAQIKENAKVHVTGCPTTAKKASRTKKARKADEARTGHSRVEHSDRRAAR
jgi:hypothetical protein